MARWNRPRGQGWGSLLNAEQRQFGIAAFVQFALLGIALRDWLKRPGSQMRGGSKWKWFPVLFVNFAGPIIYLVWGRRG
ncbi:MAG: PLDc N-terminal domain-containing protein [Chloroflexi bacterium]|nr:PLDc N-terminal domain-containing protein [Chloroflexota bacterium]MQC16616.1 PLDc_N domain-containing protein [Chloroflexota bacterium]